MLKALVFCSTVALAAASLVNMEHVKAQNLASLSYAVDFKDVADASTFLCFINQGNNVAFVRAYSADNSGSFDNNAVTSIKNAHEGAAAGVEIYMTPASQSTKTGAQQVDELYTGLNTNGINVRSVWIQVANSAGWGAAIDNVAFINSAVTRAQQRGLKVGIYTSSAEWNQITNNYSGLSSSVSLWYWSVNGSGYSGETPDNFNDFTSFGSWTAPTVKQFAQSEHLCGLTVNRNVYVAGSSAL